MFGSVQQLCYEQLLCLKPFPTHPGLCFYEIPLVNHQPGSCRLWFNAFHDMGDSETLFSFPRRALKPSHCRVFSTRKWSYCKTKREQDASAQEGELSLEGRSLGPGLHPGKSYFPYKSNDWKLSPVSLQRHDPTCTPYF